MKKILTSISLCALLISASAFCEDKNAPTAASKDFSNVKIGFIDPYGVLDKSKEWKDVAGSITADVESRAKKIEKMKADFKKKESELKNMGNAAKESAKEEKQKELLNLQNTIMIEERALQEIPQQKAQQAQFEMLKKIEAASKKIAQAHGLDVVLAGSTIFVADRLNITDLVAEEMNKGYKPAAKPKPVPAKK